MQLLPTGRRVAANRHANQIKVEPDLFYEACDKLGLLVIQDMPSTKTSAQPNEEEQAEFRRQLEIMVNEHKSYPSIVTWVSEQEFNCHQDQYRLTAAQMIYNEGWGQLDDGQPEEELTAVVRKLDPSRLIDSVSGWDDHGFGDYHVSVLANDVTMPRSD